MNLSHVRRHFNLPTWHTNYSGWTVVSHYGKITLEKKSQHGTIRRWRGSQISSKKAWKNNQFSQFADLQNVKPLMQTQILLHKVVTASENPNSSFRRIFQALLLYWTPLVGKIGGVTRQKMWWKRWWQAGWGVSCYGCESGWTCNNLSSLALVTLSGV